MYFYSIGAASPSTICENDIGPIVPIASIEHATMNCVVKVPKLLVVGILRPDTRSLLFWFDHAAGRLFQIITVNVTNSSGCGFLSIIQLIPNA